MSLYSRCPFCHRLEPKGLAQECPKCGEKLEVVHLPPTRDWFDTDKDKEDEKP